MGMKAAGKPPTPRGNLMRTKKVLVLFNHRHGHGNGKVATANHLHPEGNLMREESVGLIQPPTRPWEWEGGNGKPPTPRLRKRRPRPWEIFHRSIYSQTKLNKILISFTTIQQRSSVRHKSSPLLMIVYH